MELRGENNGIYISRNSLGLFNTDLSAEEVQSTLVEIL